MTDPVSFALAMLALLAVPGPTNTLLALAGAQRGVGGAFQCVLAEMAGYAMAIAALRGGLEPVLAAYPQLGTGLRLVLVGLLAWLALRLWRQGKPVDGTTRAVGPRAVFITTLFNPKALIIAFAVLPPPGTPLGPYAAGGLAMVLVCGLGWSLAGHGLERCLSGRYPCLLPRLGAVALALFGAMLGASTI